MRFLHTADWHIGKKLHGYDLLEDQRDMMTQLLAMIDEYQVDALVIAGDIYDRSVPAVEAVALFNQTIEEMNLTKRLPIFAVSGNHDSATRLHTGAPWYAQSQFYLATSIEESMVPVSFMGTQFFFLPYLEPIAARLYFEDDTILTIAQAVARIVDEMQTLFDPKQKHVLISHFFVAGSLRSESETPIEVGGLASVPRDIFSVFDYTALGHLHSRHALKEGTVRYSGSPLCYSLGEAKEKKGVFIVDTQTQELTFAPINPLRPVKTLEASFEQLVDPSFYQGLRREAFWHFELTDRAVIPNMMNQLREIYPNILGVQRKVEHKNEDQNIKLPDMKKALAPNQVIPTFFKERTGEGLTDRQQQWLDQGLIAAMDTEKRDKACNPND